ncbi:hypothetical protein SDJN03_24016, partial [Cucurbita argyrosperma subsp. sororia]
MGCSCSKRIEATVDVYRPAPASFAVFDINAIEEPWVEVMEEPPPLPAAPPVKEEKAGAVPVSILEKLSGVWRPRFLTLGKKSVRPLKTSSPPSADETRTEPRPVAQTGSNRSKKTYF